MGRRLRPCSRSPAPPTRPRSRRTPNPKFVQRSTRKMSTLRIGASTLALLIGAALFARSAHAQAPLEPGKELTLGRAIELSLHNHPRGLAARSEASSVNETIGEARSQMLPQVYGSAQYLGATDNG